MAQTFDEKIPFFKEGLEFSGLFKRGHGPSDNPLVVLIHGGGATAGYFDNSCHSYATDFFPFSCFLGNWTKLKRLTSPRVVKGFSDLGYDVLNINRPGYGGTATPTTKTPLRDSLPGFIDFIDQVYREKKGGHGGIVLIGHSLGAALSLVIAVEAGDRLPVLGVSALGTLPTEGPLGLVPDPDPDPTNPRFILEQSYENITRFLGDIDCINMDALSTGVMAVAFEPGR
jgi:pimeloyl-ACP methyl ester carboxylesterase